MLGIGNHETVRFSETVHWDYTVVELTVAKKAQVKNERCGRKQRQGCFLQDSVLH